MKELDIVDLLKKHDETGLKKFQLYYTPLMRYIISPILKDADEQEECCRK